MTSKLGIHIFGDGSGETIFIQFPNNSVGIIDFGAKDFISWFEEYIEQNQLSKISFLLWTHPHDDHTRYLIDLLKYCESKNINIGCFSRFHYTKMKEIAKLIDYDIEKLVRVARESPYNYGERSKPKYLSELIEKIQTLKQNKIIEIIDNHLSLGYELFPIGILCKNVSIHCIAPYQDDIEFYKEKHELAIQKIAETNSYDCSEIRNFNPESKIHNRISVAITIKFFDINIILGGDVENPSWKKIIEDVRYQNYTKPKILFLKTPHHGSKTAYLESLWNDWGKDFHTIITTFNRSNLPNNETINEMLKHTKNIYILKDKKEKTFFGDGDKSLMIKQLDLDKIPITSAKNATHHIYFSISENGNVEHRWI